MFGLNSGEVQWEHAWEIHGGAPLVVRPPRLKEIKHIFMSRILSVQPQANMGSSLVE